MNHKCYASRHSTDEAPTVALSKFTEQSSRHFHSEVLAFEILASDDFGVKRIGLEWEGIRNPIHNPEPTSGEKIVSGGTPTADTVTVAATFSPKRERVKPQSLRLRAYAEDYLPGRDRIYSSYLVLHVLTPSEHFKWLVGQMQLWTGAAKDVHDKELQLHQINRELRDLPAETLDDPAQRKRIQEQAAAERANAARLDSLVETGRDSWFKKQQRTKNLTLNSWKAWGDIIERLAEISGQRMPSVADLLSRAAEAPGDAC